MGPSAVRHGQRRDSGGHTTHCYECFLLIDPERVRVVDFDCISTVTPISSVNSPNLLITHMALVKLKQSKIRTKIFNLGKGLVRKKR